MIVVPVMDLMRGRVVRAERGNRHAYTTMHSAWCREGDPLALVDALVKVAGFTTLYIADLDAIAGRPDHRAALETIRAAHPGLVLWVDAGFASVDSVAAWTPLAIVPVIGTESLPDLDTAETMLATMPHAVLSLDSLGDARLGPSALFDRPDLWPSTLIMMTLERVGSREGAAIDRIRLARTLRPDVRIVAAGGVRNAQDLEQLEALGVHAALVASAIHDGTLDRRTLARYASA